MGEKTMEAMKKLGCVHASPQGVSPNLWASQIKITDVELFDELGTIEATWHMDLDKLGPFVIDIDTQGNNLFEKVDAIVGENKAQVYAKLGLEDFEYTKLY